MSSPLLSVVVLTHNRAASLDRALRALAAHTREASETIVVDNGSTDDTPALLAERGTLHVRRPTNEGVTARNHGFERARGRFIAQVDDDVEVLAGWDRSLLDCLGRDVKAAGPAGFLLHTSDWIRAHGTDALAWNTRPAPTGERCDLLEGWCWLFSNEDWRYDAYWRERPQWHEEAELQLRMRAHGYRFACSPAVAVHHELRDRERTDWELHNRNLEFVVKRWYPQRRRLGLEGHPSERPWILRALRRRLQRLPGRSGSP